MHLRPLVYVVDIGWNLNVAVENIEKIVKVPVVAIGGAGGISDLRDAIHNGHAHAATGGKCVCILWSIKGCAYYGTE